MSAAEESARVLGRLTELGMEEPWQVALLLPGTFQDFGVVETDAAFFEEERQVTIAGQVRQPAQVARSGKVPRITVVLGLADGSTVEATWFGDIAPIKAELRPGVLACVHGRLRLFHHRWQISDPTLVDPKWQGRCMPHYPSLGKRMGAATLRDRVIGQLRVHLDRAASECAGMLSDLASEAEVLQAIGAPDGASSFSKLLVRAHCPINPETGRAACDAMDRFAAAVMLKELIASRDREQNDREPLALNLSARMEQWPVTPSSSQASAIRKLSAVYSAPHNARALLSGDVGSGKTFVYLTLAAAVVDAGGRVAILLPGEPLANQVHADLKRIFPDVEAALVTAGTSSSGKEAPVAIGTTALLNRGAGSFDLVITDEQQKLGAEQRRQLLGPTTHQLDVTATAIPRTMALASFGMLEIVQLRGGHTEKKIHTKLWPADGHRDLFAGVRRTVAAGGRILVVYPAIGESGKAGTVRSIEDVREKWEKLFPGRVRVIHGRVAGDQKNAALEDMCTGAADVAICTTAVEVGINIPNMRRVVVVHPERHGLTGLHQIRGRLAREGGEGFFDMLPMGPLSDESTERLRLLEKFTDGFELAEADLKLRGPGELASSGTRQSGGIGSILFKRAFEPELFTEMEPVVTRWFSRRLHTPAAAVAEPALRQAGSR